MPGVETSSYKVVLDAFGDDVVRDRFVYLYERMHSFLSANDLREKVTIQTDLLSQAVIDYFTDIYRLKEFQGIERANLQKIVSYEVYWLLRRKPMQVVADEGADNALAFVNERFLVTYMMHELLTELGKGVPEGDLPGECLDFVRHLEYHLKYRAVDPKNLELTIDAFRAGLSLA